MRTFGSDSRSTWQVHGDRYVRGVIHISWTFLFSVLLLSGSTLLLMKSLQARVQGIAIGRLKVKIDSMK